MRHHNAISLAEAASKHFFPKIKEPHFHATDLHGLSRVSSAMHYRLLYASAPRPSLKGDASVFTYFSRAAIPKILESQPQAKFIFLLRNPIDMFFSLHYDYVRRGSEQLRDPEKAWNAGPMRQKTCSRGTWTIYNYQDVCKLGVHLKRVINSVPKDQLHIVLLEDVQENPDRELRSIHRFLNIEELTLDQYTKENEAVELPPLLSNIYKHLFQIRTSIPIPPLGFDVMERLKRLFARPAKRPTVRQEFAEYLERIFDNEIKIVEEVVGRSLNVWRKAAILPQAHV